MKPVLFISHSKRGLFYYNDASARYRCVFPAEALIAEGHAAHAIHFSQVDKIHLQHYGKVVFHRPQFSLKLRQIIRYLKKNNIEHWVDFDDLLFRPELSASSAAVQSGKMSFSLAKKHALRYQRALSLFRNCQVSTDVLAEHVAENLKKASGSRRKSASALRRMNIKVTYNQIPERWVKQLDRKSLTLSLADKVSTRLEKKIIRYLPGTSHHKHDFAFIEQFLVELLRENPHYHLNVIGDLEFHHSDFPSDQISHTAFQRFEQLPSLINDSWIIIAPLVNNVFNQCKSALKFWESGVFGIPVISSPLGDMERFKNKGLCISDDIEVWKDFIVKMEDSELYYKAAKSAISAAQKAVIPQTLALPLTKDINPTITTTTDSINSPSDKTEHQRYAYLKLTGQFGPRWPADIINPYSKNHTVLVTKTEDLIDNINAKADSEHSLRVNFERMSKADVPPKRNKTLRKVKKLINSPQAFFKDMKIGKR